MSEKLVTIATFSKVFEAEFSKTRLESEGIECFLVDENSGTWIGLPAIIGGVRLQVKESDADRAIEILQK